MTRSAFNVQGAGSLTLEGPTPRAVEPPAEAAYLRSLPALQQPDWTHEEVAVVSASLQRRPPIAAREEVDELSRLLKCVAEERLQIIQAGDCAEHPDECQRGQIARKVAMLDLLAGAMRLHGGKPILRVGRIAGQFAKPRSRATESVEGVELPVYRGHGVNRPEPDIESRRADPAHLLKAHRAARIGHRILREEPRGAAPVWTSHEALLLDYELPLLRTHEDGRLYLTSTHFPWVGDRTRDPDGAHIAMLGLVANPVACKVGPSITAEALAAVCERLDPGRRPGRLMLIARLGAQRVAELLPPLVDAVVEAGHPALWMCDPMHGNTVVGAGGVKTRRLDMIRSEIADFQSIVGARGGIVAGLHLETTPDAVLECVEDARQIDEATLRPTSLCDPRLNPHQCVSVATHWGVQR